LVLKTCAYISGADTLLKRLGVGVSKGDEGAVAWFESFSRPLLFEGVTRALAGVLSLVLKGSTLCILPPVCGVCRPVLLAVVVGPICHGSLRRVDGVANSDVLTALLGVSAAIMALASSVLKASSASSMPYSSSRSITAWLRFRLGPDAAVLVVYGGGGEGLRLAGVLSLAGAASVRALLDSAAVSRWCASESQRKNLQRASSVCGFWHERTRGPLTCRAEWWGSGSLHHLPLFGPCFLTSK
jgi:hypothetical protein